MVPEQRPVATAGFPDFKKYPTRLKQRLDPYRLILQRFLQNTTWTPGDSPPPPAAAPDLVTQPCLREDHKGTSVTFH